MDFIGKRILITGSSRGIGRAAAEAFLERGAHVAINGRNPDTVAAAVSSLDAGDRLVPVVGDIGSAGACATLVATALDSLGGLDILVNSAGVAHATSIEDSDEAVWDETLDTNLKGTFFTSRAALAALRTSGGNIVNLASDAGLIGEAGLSVYCASKGGVVNMTKALALELAPKVRVNCVCPGYVDTDMVRRDFIEKAEDPSVEEQEIIDYAPLKRMASPEEIAYAIVYLASDMARNITGAALQIDGGSTAGHP